MPYLALSELPDRTVHVECPGSTNLGQQALGQQQLVTPPGRALAEAVGLDRASPELDVPLGVLVQGLHERGGQAHGAERSGEIAHAPRVFRLQTTQTGPGSQLP